MLSEHDLNMTYSEAYSPIYLDDVYGRPVKCTRDSCARIN
jgi:hypothetical protein